MKDWLSIDEERRFYIVRNFLQWSLLLSKANEKEEEKITKIISDLPNFDAIIRPTIKKNPRWMLDRRTAWKSWNKT